MDEKNSDDENITLNITEQQKTKEHIISQLKKKENVLNDLNKMVVDSDEDDDPIKYDDVLQIIETLEKTINILKQKLIIDKSLTKIIDTYVCNYINKGIDLTHIKELKTDSLLYINSIMSKELDKATTNVSDVILMKQKIKRFNRLKAYIDEELFKNYNITG